MTAADPASSLGTSTFRDQRIQQGKRMESMSIQQRPIISRNIHTSQPQSTPQNPKNTSPDGIIGDLDAQVTNANQIEREKSNLILMAGGGMQTSFSAHRSAQKMSSSLYHNPQFIQQKRMQQDAVREQYEGESDWNGMGKVNEKMGEKNEEGNEKSVGKKSQELIKEQYRLTTGGSILSGESSISKMSMNSNTASMVFSTMSHLGGPNLNKKVGLGHFEKKRTNFYPNLLQTSTHKDSFDPNKLVFHTVNDNGLADDDDAVHEVTLNKYLDENKTQRKKSSKNSRQKVDLNNSNFGIEENNGNNNGNNNLLNSSFDFDQISHNNSHVSYYNDQTNKDAL